MGRNSGRSRAFSWQYRCLESQAWYLQWRGRVEEFKRRHGGFVAVTVISLGLPPALTWVSNLAAESVPAPIEVVAPPPPRLTVTGNVINYVSVGDSYTSGPGIGLPDPTSAGSDCDRSNRNYPKLLAAKLEQLTKKKVNLKDPSCQGVSIQDVLGFPRAGAPKQLDYIKSTTNLVTIHLGGNEERLFGRLQRECLVAKVVAKDGAVCTVLNQKVHDDTLVRDFTNVKVGIELVIDRVRQKAPNATIVVLNYQGLMSEQGSCARLPISARDAKYLRAIQQYLNAAILKGVADKATTDTKVAALDVAALLQGHDVCSRTPGVNGLVLRPNGQGTTMHPNAASHEFIAEALAYRLTGVPPHVRGEDTTSRASQQRATAAARRASSPSARRNPAGPGPGSPSRGNLAGSPAAASSR